MSVSKTQQDRRNHFRGQGCSGFDIRARVILPYNNRYHNLRIPETPPSNIIDLGTSVQLPGPLVISFLQTYSLFSRSDPATRSSDTFAIVARYIANRFSGKKSQPNEDYHKGNFANVFDETFNSLYRQAQIYKRDSNKSYHSRVPT